MTKLLNIVWFVLLLKHHDVSAIETSEAAVDSFGPFDISAYHPHRAVNSMDTDDYYDYDDDYDESKYIDVQSLLQLNDASDEHLDVNSEVITLSSESASIGTFHPLDCNVDLSAAPCTTKVSDILSSLINSPLIIPCGECVLFDLEQDVIIAGGLNIKGKLKFPNNQKVTIHTPFVIVQGELSIKVDHDTISPNSESVAFNITGMEDIKFKPTDSPNTDACALSNGECNLGRKPFVVAGGKLNIDAFPSSCSTHTPILATKTKDIAPNKDDFPAFELLPASCPVLGTDFIKDDFGNWTGWWGGYVSVVNETLKVTNRQTIHQGPHLDITSLRPALCLIPDKVYLLSVRIKFDKAGNEGLPTLCSTDGTNCANFGSKIGKPTSGHYHKYKSRLGQAYNHTYGEWHQWTDTIKWNTDELSSDNPYFVLYIDSVEAGVDISLSNFSITLPDEASFPDPDDLCGELILRGDAEGNTSNPYPIRKTDWRDRDLTILEEKGNRFYRLEGRHSRHSSITSNLNTNCFERGITYKASVKVRIHSESQKKFYFYLTGRPISDTGDWMYRTYLECPPQDISDDWVICSGHFMVDDEMAQASELTWRFVFHKKEDIDDVDFDDISISYHKGYVDSLVVSSNAASCWGSGSELHIGTSTYFNTYTLKANGYNSVIDSTKDNSDGTLNIKLGDIPILPILSATDSLELKADVALLSRNIKIYGAEDEENKGAYVQIIHTPKVSQLISGVEFFNMGRQSESDRFAIQLLYSGSLEGSIISKNSFHDNWRCIVIEGTSNVTISNNVGYRNNGHCILIGSQSQDNIIEKNFISETRPATDKWPGHYDDHTPAAFKNEYNPNNYFKNVAVGNSHYGFRSIISADVKLEDGTVTSPIINPQTIPMGQFSQNEAKSNGHSGFYFYYNKQIPERNILDTLLAVKNRYYGLYLYKAHRMSIYNSLLAENDRNAWTVWSDDIKISDSEIRGVSSMTKSLVSPPYFNRPCTSSSLSQFGYKMQTNMHKIGSDGWEKVKGARLKNVHFSLFDNDDDCLDSFPIVFDTINKHSLKHWDFISTFQNVTFDGKKIMTASAASEAGVPDIVITDPDGNSDPAGQSFGPGSFVSNKPHLKNFSYGSCNVYDEGIVYCNNTCLRTLNLYVDQIFSEDYDLKVTRIEDDFEREVIVPAYYIYDDNRHLKTYEMNQRMYSIPIPFGNYTLKFFQNGIHVWPNYVYEQWEGIPQCEGYASISNIAIIKPAITNDHCDELFINSNMKNGLEAWKHRDANYGNLELLTGVGINGTNAIGYFNKRDTYHGVGQDIDTRCFPQDTNDIYEIKIWFRLQEGIVPVSCNRFDGSYPNRCPSVTLKQTVHKNMKKDITKDYYNGDAAQTVMPINSTTFNLMHGILNSNSIRQKILKLFLYIERYDESYDLILDTFSVKKLKKACAGDLVRNGNFESGYSSFFTTYGTGKYDIVSSSNGYSLKIYDRTHTSHGVYQDLYIDLACVNKGDRFFVQGKFKLEDTQGNRVDCVWKLNQCSGISLRRESIDEGTKHTLVTSIVAIYPDEYEKGDNWSLMAGIFTFDKIEANHTRMYLILHGSITDTVIYDDISIIPLEKYCDQIVMNPSFEDGTTSYWQPYHHAYADYSIIRPSSKSSKFALLFQHDHNSATLTQSLDTRCILEDQRFDISAKIKLLNVTDLSKPMSCDPGQRNIRATDHCPTLGLTFTDCQGENMYLTLWNKKQSSWVPDELNHYEYDLIITSKQASCENVQIKLGYYLPFNQALVVDEIKISKKAYTKAPTLFPTVTYTSGPTKNPTIITDYPTTSYVQTCPPSGSGSVQLKGNSVMLQIADTNILCTLTKFLPSKPISEMYSLSRRKYKNFSSKKDVSFIPIARSYNLNKWELSAGGTVSSTFDSKELTCYSQGCQINLPPLKEGATYYLTSYTYNLNQRDEYARFLETATYGMTKTELDDFEIATRSKEPMSVVTDFIDSQMNETITPITSHREFWRKRANPRAPTSTNIGVPNHPCSAFSRWRKFTFVRNDLIWGSKSLRVKGDGPYALYYDGIFRTTVDKFWIEKNSTYKFDPEFDYIICYWPEERIGGALYIRLEDDICVKAENPQINGTGYLSNVEYTLDLPNTLEMIDAAFGGEEFILSSALNDAICNNIPTAPELGDALVFGLLQGSNWLQFDPRLNLKENTPTSPISDGGKREMQDSGGTTACSNAPRSFLNEDSCMLSADACKSSSLSSEIQILLNATTIAKLYALTNRYVYGIKGLFVVDQTDKSESPWKLSHPCTPLMRSRWQVKTMNNCNPTVLMSGTNSSLFKLLSESTDPNEYIRDVYFPEGMTCDVTDTDPKIDIVVDGQCWQRVHEDYLSIYDITYWVNKHPGGKYQITKWKDTNEPAFIVFPNAHPNIGHSMDRWYNNKNKFSYIGRYGDSLRIRDLPNALRTRTLLKFYEDASNVDDNNVLVCGSPGENANEPPLGFVFDVYNGFQTGYWSIRENKQNSWIMASLNAKDQLRQRVAWALSQILVVVKAAINRGNEMSESFLSYYDIFVRNAFGNYRDILKEISYSPLMAENLSFLESKSSSYIWERQRIKVQPDENFAREIMQLFSMGLNKLNLDGSFKLDKDGNKFLAYTNDDIMSLSRAWTGFKLQQTRGNMESDNRIDPLVLEASWRDRFPKSDTTGNYIGDFFYPLCVDLPNKAFLKVGAKYRFLGGSSLPELMNDPNEFKSDDSINRFMLDLKSSLREELCNENSSGECQFANTVILQSSKICSGIECDVDNVRVLQLETGVFYEYVRQPCVNQVFYNEAKKISMRHRSYPVMCANPKLPDASEACCDIATTTATRNSKYDGERIRWNTATNRCSEVSKELCDFYYVSGSSLKNSNYFWTPNNCELRVKVNNDGRVAVVHHLFDSSNEVLHVDKDNENWFKVYWTTYDNYPKVENDCDSVCDIVDNFCLCGTYVQKRKVFNEAPTSVSDMMKKLVIGAVDPNMFNIDSYVFSTDPGTNITIHLENGQGFNQNTIFEYFDDKGRIYFLKNSAETVLVKGVNGESTGYSFRNSPQFMDLIPQETTQRDAIYETEATLDHYFYHDNTAPFLALRLIQRITISNPTPRYIKAVATAFKEGYYKNGGKLFGTGKYGDMAATFASIYLDREARTVVLDADPSNGALREPVIKFMSVLRSMDFVSTYPIMRFGNVKNNIGQINFEFESVFSFFLPEFSPQGRVGDALLVSPEATLLDMPKILGLLNGLNSLVQFGLSSCNGGLGVQCINKPHLPSPFGVLEYNRTVYDSEFFNESFEGPSLKGGLDNEWVGRDISDYYGEVTVDPLDPTNHVYHPTPANYYARFFSPPATNSKHTVVKFNYYGVGNKAGGCIGYSKADTLNSETWMYCDYPNMAPNDMTSNDQWISCQFVVPQDFYQFRIVLGDRAGTGGAYFDNVQVSTSSIGTTCIGVNITSQVNGELGRSDAVVNDLATMLTAGRLSSENRKIISEAYDNAGSANDGLKVAQQLILTTAEFHTTNIMKQQNQPREEVTFPDPTGKPYKAIVYVMFSGGADSYNMLIPHTCEQKDMYQEYLDVRLNVALPKSNLLPIDANNQICQKFGLHPDLPVIQKLYNEKDLLFFANTGVMTQPVNKLNYYYLTKSQLFAHNSMQQESKRVDPYDVIGGTGVVGRIADALAGKGHNSGFFSIDRFSVALVGRPGINTPPMTVRRNGLSPIYLNDKVEEPMLKLHNKTLLDSGFFADTWSNAFIQSLGINELLHSQLKDASTNTTFPTSSLSQQFEIVANLISTREARGVDTDTFYIEIGGFDTHSNVEENLSNRFIEVNEGFQAFAAELKIMGLWKSVTTIQVSEFARTLNPNSGAGTDHAWGGNYMMMGGAVNGGNVIGQYPDDLTDDGPLTLSRGRMIPTTPWDAVFRGMAHWFGVPNKMMNDVLPNLGNFDDTILIDPADMFSDIVSTDNPTSSPTSNSTKNPTGHPTNIPTSHPTNSPTSPPTTVATSHPSNSPTSTPTSHPTNIPTSHPTNIPTNIPTKIPSFISICFDDSSYRMNSRNCKQLKDKNKCEKEDKETNKYVFQHCPKSCSKCPCQNDDWFWQIQNQDCNWVSAEPDARCEIIGASEHCAKVCNKQCCSDDSEWLYKNKEGKDCSWVKRKKYKKCQKDEKVMIACPYSCSLCK